MEIYCSGGSDHPQQAHTIQVGDVEYLRPLRRVLYSLGWVNDALCGWTCPEHQKLPRSGWGAGALEIAEQGGCRPGARRAAGRRKQALLRLPACELSHTVLPAPSLLY